LTVKVGDRVDRRDEIGRVDAADEDAARVAADRLLASLRWSEKRVSPPPLVYRWRESPNE
jgi:hypothetical protein